MAHWMRQSNNLVRQNQSGRGTAFGHRSIDQALGTPQRGVQAFGVERKQACPAHGATTGWAPHFAGPDWSGSNIVAYESSDTKDVEKIKHTRPNT